MTFTSAGRLGIGTTSPSYPLQVNGDVYSSGGWLRVSGTKGLYFQSYGGGFYMSDATWIRTYGSKSFYHNSGIMRTDGTLQVGPSGNRFIVNTSGSVGIGTTALSAKLQVAGMIYSTTGGIKLPDGTILASEYDLGGGGGSSLWLSGTDGIYYDGKVGIGTNQPKTDFEIYHATETYETPDPTVRLFRKYMDDGVTYRSVWEISNTNNLIFRYGNSTSSDDPVMNNKLLISGSLVSVQSANLVVGGYGYFTDYLRVDSDHPYLQIEMPSGGDYTGELRFNEDYTNVSRLFWNTDSRDLVLENNGNQAIIIEEDGLVKVNGTLKAEKVEVIASVVPDYVFKQDYKLRTLKEVENYINTHGHLPGIPSEAEVMEKGSYDLGEMNTVLLEKIEELTLYILDLNQTINDLNAKVEQLESQ
ncbi:hypothetical protein ES708_12509 [subsurface metagenome]